MADLIDRQAVKEKIGFVNLYFRAHGQEKYLDDLIDEISPVDAVEVVRCGECKHYEDHKRKIYENCIRDRRLVPMTPTDFCSYGERREENA